MATPHSIDIKLVNDAKLQKLFSELTPRNQTKIVVDGYKIAGKIIANEAKSNLGHVLVLKKLVVLMVLKSKRWRKIVLVLK